MYNLTRVSPSGDTSVYSGNHPGELHLPAPFREAMREFECQLEESLHEQGDYLSESDKALYRKGKRVRPKLLLLFALLCHPQELSPSLSSKVIGGAVSLEMLHVATLIHDDIIDAAAVRRGHETIYARQGTEMAILIGDLQFVQAIRKFTQLIENAHDLQLVQQVLDTGMELCKGEIDELKVDPGVSDLLALESRYMRTIDRKTARLISVSCRAGAALVNGSRRACWYAGQFGQKIGLAFQIMDDLKDLIQDLETAGKKPGTDLARKRVTLPHIYALPEFGPDHILHRLLTDRGYEPSPKELEEARHAVLHSSGMVQAYSKARELVLDAVELLQLFPPGPYCSEIERMARSILE
ncbi:hypothetical protein BK138_09350 [Paenibacillus rhizosphaerae]|uniref:Polyprenyl synthetase n=1 Tax=Paenibacillus rhizosphaerae TaxID=297318 RepID=A0A1R1F3N9_9BACL|nr:polyprenyl synthetase family protein [Paenibacillus rhizosphaerae]OMF58693.1 hypothetical protein BK138_09350 [Paenibacillus rhizosphaerae]